MRRLAILPFVMLVVACADTVTEPVTDPPAPAFSEHDNAAVVLHDENFCFVLDGLGNWFTGNFELPCGVEVATNAEGITAKLTIHASGVPNPTGKTVHWGPYNPAPVQVSFFSLTNPGFPTIYDPPYPCFLRGPEPEQGFLFTLNWHAWVTPSGQAKFSCHYNHESEYQWPDYDPPIILWSGIAGLNASNAATVDFTISATVVDENLDGTAVESAIVQVTVNDAGPGALCPGNLVTEAAAQVTPEGGNDDATGSTVIADVTAEVQANSGDFDWLFTATNLGVGEYTYCFEIVAEDQSGNSSSSTASKDFTWQAP